MLSAFEDTWTMLVAFYLTARLFMASYLVLLMFLIPMIRNMMIVHVTMTLIPSALWIGSIYVEYPNRLILVWIAIFIDLTGSMFAIFFIKVSKKVSKRLGAWSDKAFEFYPAVNIEHKVERTNAFVTLVFGYSVVAIIYQSSAHYGLNAFFGKAVLGLIQAFCFNWIYFEIDGMDLFSHAIRRNVTSGKSSHHTYHFNHNANHPTAMLWSSVHLPFIMAYVLGAAALSKLVVAHDCADADPHDLTHFYEEKSEEHIPVGLRWFYCGGFAIALAGMAVISLCHIHKDSAKGIRILKRYRLINRCCVCIILLLLPLSEHLSSLQLVSIVTGLLLWVLLMELWGVSCPQDTWFGQEGGKCKYIAKCRISKRDLESAVKGGQVIKVEELKDRGEKGGMYEVA
jgi:hypothetical protein